MRDGGGCRKWECAEADPAKEGVDPPRFRADPAAGLPKRRNSLLLVSLTARGGGARRWLAAGFRCGARRPPPWPRAGLPPPWPRTGHCHVWAPASPCAVLSWTANRERDGAGRGGEGRTFRERRWLPAARYMISGEASVSNCGAAAGVEEGQKPAVRGGALEN